MSGGWVCPECGLDYDTVSPRDAAAAVRSFPRRYRSVLDGFEVEDDRDALIRRRPAPTTWSAIEYTAHVADLMELFISTIETMTREDHPSLEFFDSDERAAERAYNQADPDKILADLDRSCSALASVIDGVSATDWDRTGAFAWGDRDALTMVRNAVHEGSHHLRDIEKGLASMGAGGEPGSP